MTHPASLLPILAIRACTLPQHSSAGCLVFCFSLGIWCTPIARSLTNRTRVNLQHALSRITLAHGYFARLLTHLLAIRSRPYKPSNSLTFPLFSCFEPAAAFCRQQSTFCILAPKRALLRWDGFLSSFAGQCCMHQMTCSFRVRVICGRLLTLPA